MLLDGRDKSRRPRWRLSDRLIVLAFDQYEASLCPDCSQQRARGYNPELADSWQVQPVPCYSCKALENARSQQKDAKGLKNYIVDAGPADAEPYKFALTPMSPEDWAEING